MKSRITVDEYILSMSHEESNALKMFIGIINRIDRINKGLTEKQSDMIDKINNKLYLIED